jgi:hypothetical protein
VQLALVLGWFGTALFAEDAPMAPKQRYADAIALQAEAPERMIALLSDLAAEGNARAMDRLGYFTLKGIGTDQSAARAIAFYQQAIAAGRSASLVSLGKVYLSEGAYQSAVDTLTEASALGEEKARAVLAWAHATQRLGGVSDPQSGFAALTGLASEDMREAQIYLLDAAVRRNRTPGNIGYVLDRLHARQAEGDAKSAEALLRFYRMHGHARGTLQMREALLQTEGLRDKIRIE